jgi:hypothetical protein
VGDERGAADSLPRSPPHHWQPARAEKNPDRLVSIVCLAKEEGGSEVDQAPLETLAPSELTVERDIGFEPTTFSLGKRKRPFRAVTGSAK